MVQPVFARTRAQCTLDLPTDPAAPADGPPPSPPDPEAALEMLDHYRVPPPAAPPPARTPSAVTQQRLDAFREAMTPRIHTPEGDVAVPIAFAMGAPVPGAPEAQPGDHALLARTLDQCGITGAARQAVMSARGAPADIRRVTQALVDAGRLPQGTSVPLFQRVREMMLDLHIGVDCAGYTQQAYLASRRTSRETAGFDSPLDESLASLDSRGFMRVRTVAALRPGDIVSMGPPRPGEVGHRAIVYEQRRATPSDIEDFNGAYGTIAPAFTQGEVYVVDVDSSWGNGGQLDYGGVQRRTWWYNATSNQWAWQAEVQDCPGTITVMTGPDPDAHPLIGFFRGPGAGTSPPR